MFAYLIYTAFLIAVLGFYVFVAWTTGRWLAIRLGRRYVVPVALVAAIGTPVAWIYGSAISFSHACEWAPATQVFTRAAQSEDGFLVNDLGYQWFACHKSSFAPTQLSDSGVFAFYERPYGWDRSPKFRRQFTRSFENVDSLQSRYVFELAAPV